LKFRIKLKTARCYKIRATADAQYTKLRGKKNALRIRGPKCIKFTLKLSFKADSDRL